MGAKFSSKMLGSSKFNNLSILFLIVFLKLENTEVALFVAFRTFFSDAKCCALLNFSLFKYGGPGQCAEIIFWVGKMIDVKI